MKTTIQIAVFLLLCKITYSQPFDEAMPSYQIIELQYENSSDEKGITRFRYDNNQLIKAFWTLKDKSRYSINYYEHDANGNLISAFRDFSDGLTSFECFNYDSAGNKISEFFYRSDSIYGAATYIYNGSRLIGANFDNYKGRLNGRLDIQYNSRNQKKKGVLKNNGRNICEISYDYDKAGNLKKELWDFNGKWSQTFRYIYALKKRKKLFYSSPFLSKTSNYRIPKENYTFNNEIGGPSQYYYNKSGLLEKKVFTRSDSLTTTTFYNYDNDGKLISSRRLYSDGSVARFTYTYDGKSKLIRRNYLRADTLYGFEAYLYNNDNELLKAYLKNFDGWLTGTINFETNELGEILSGEFIGENGFNAFITFHYNEEKLVSEIIWEFSFGKFQKYQFEYEPIQLP